MNRVELKRLWKRSKTDPKFSRLLHLMLATLVTLSKDEVAACELAHFILLKAGRAGRGDLRRRLTTMGREF